MSVASPAMLVVALVVVAALGVGYLALHRRPAAAAIHGGAARASRWRRHVPPLLFLLALFLLLVGVSRPIATVQAPRLAGTVILAFDVSNSMMATDVSPSRLGAAQAAAAEFVRAQPGTVDVGVVAFDQGAITVREPTNSHEETVAAINRLRAAGGTSLGQAILASLSAIIGEPVALPDPESEAALPDLGYWGSATIVVLSDGEDTGGPDALLAAELAAAAGVRVETVGVGTLDGTTIEVDGFTVATALDEQSLTAIAQATAGSYHPAADASQLADIYRDLDLRRTSLPQVVELAGAAVGGALLLLVAGGLLMTAWHGRIV